MKAFGVHEHLHAFITAGERHNFGAGWQLVAACSFVNIGLAMGGSVALAVMDGPPGLNCVVLVHCSESTALGLRQLDQGAGTKRCAQVRRRKLARVAFGKRS